MAGAYDDAPSRRMATDGDGTVGYEIDTMGAAMIDLSPSDMAILNDESENFIEPQARETGYFRGYLFPEPREFDGVFLATVSGYATNYTLCATSTNTTNGIDGTWVTQIADPTDWTTVGINFRNEIESAAASSAVGLRVSCNQQAFGRRRQAAFHTYGTISPGETPDRILFLDPLNADAEFTKVLDYGDVPRGQTQQRTIKIKNNSASYTINTLQMTAEDLYLNAGGFYTFSLDDVTYQATLNSIGNLGPGATKLIYVKQSIPDAELLGIQTGRIKIAHASLT